MKAGADRLITLNDPGSPAAEAYRTLRTNIQFSNLDTPPRTLMATSAGVDEDRATVLCNLAVAFAQAGTQVAVVDCDFRHPLVHQTFSLSNDKGLTTVLLAGGEGELPLQQTAVPNLRVLPAGPTPPAHGDLLSSVKMKGVIDALTAVAEVVLFNAPPVTFVADAAILASRVDGTILVVSAGKTRREMANRAKAALERVNSRILGVVLSNARLDSQIYRYYGSQKG